jgi:hypothetical protein
MRVSKSEAKSYKYSRSDMTEKYYPGIEVLKEMIQNADDAEATRISSNEEATRKQ